MGNSTTYVGAPIKVYNESQETYDIIYPKTRSDAVEEYDDKKFVTDDQQTWLGSYATSDMRTITSAQKSIFDYLSQASNLLTVGGSGKSVTLTGGVITLNSSGIEFIASNAAGIHFNQTPVVGNNNDTVVLSEQYNGAMSSLNTSISQKVDKSTLFDTDSTKLKSSVLPDYIVGQVIYGGTINASGTITLTSKGKTALGVASSTATISINDIDLTTNDKEGLYFIVSGTDVIVNTTIGGVANCSTGDWIIATGGNWTKIDNTDAVQSVCGMTGSIALESLADKFNNATSYPQKIKYSNLSEKPESLKNPYSLSMTVGSTTTSYDGSSNESISITPSAIGTYTSAEIGDAISEAVSAKSSAYVSSTAPASPKNGDIWFDTSQ